MRSNDIAVDLNELDNAGYRLDKKLREIRDFAEQLRHNMNVASREFDSVNFKRAEQVVREVISKLRQASERLQGGLAFLNGLEEKAENYLRCKYAE